MAMNIEEVLIKARELIADPKRWTQGELARDAQGAMTRFDSPDAVCFCAEGALLKVGGSWDVSKHAQSILSIVIEDNYTENRMLWAFNDLHTHEEVLGLFDKAIAEFT